MLKHLNYANVVSALAAFSVLGGSAYAAANLTGANIKDGSLQEIDFKTSSLTISDLSAAAKLGLKGPKGDTGFGGSTGDPGDTGDKGPTGDPGNPAKLTSSWNWRNTGLITDSTQFSAPNKPLLDWDAATYGNGNPGGNKPNIRTQANSTVVNLTGSYQMVVALTGMGALGTNEAREASPLGRVVLPWNAHLTAVGSMTFLHRKNGENLDTGAGGANLHGRIQCKAAYGADDTFGSFSTMGTPAYASSDLAHQLVDVTMTADAHPGVGDGLVPAGTYNVAILCRDADYSGSTQWSLASANMTVVGSAP